MTKARDIIVRLYNNIFVFSAVFFAGLGIAIYILMGKGAASMLSEQMLHREQVITRSGASAIQNFLVIYGNSVSLTAQNDLIVSKNLKEPETILKKLVESFKGTPVSGFLLVDENGKAVLNLNISGQGLLSAESLEDRDYFIWSKTAKSGEVFLGKPVISRLGASKGKMIVPVSSPIFRAGKYAGVLTSAVVLSDLTSGFLNPLKISEKSEVYLIGNDGAIIYSDRFQEPVGKNVFTYLGDNSFLGSKYIKSEVQKALEGKKEGKARVVYPIFDQSGKFLERLVAYAPINLGNGQFWYLAVSTPIKDALIFMAPFYTRQIILTILIFIAILIYSVRFSRTVGFREGHNLYHKENKPQNGA